MLLFKERLQESVGYKKPSRGEPNRSIVFYLQVSGILMSLELTSKLTSYIKAEFFQEIRHLHPSAFQLENEFSNHQLPRGYRQGPPKRELASFKKEVVVFDAIDVLHMTALEVPEGGDPCPKHVSAFPESIAIDKFRVRIANDCIGA